MIKIYALSLSDSRNLYCMSKIMSGSQFHKKIAFYQEFQLSQWLGQHYRNRDKKVHQHHRNRNKAICLIKVYFWFFLVIYILYLQLQFYLYFIYIYILVIYRGELSYKLMKIFKTKSKSRASVYPLSEVLETVHIQMFKGISPFSIYCSQGKQVKSLNNHCILQRLNSYCSSTEFLLFIFLSL